MAKRSKATPAPEMTEAQREEYDPDAMELAHLTDRIDANKTMSSRERDEDESEDEIDLGYEDESEDNEDDEEQDEPADEGRQKAPASETPTTTIGPAFSIPDEPPLNLDSVMDTGLADQFRQYREWATGSLKAMAKQVEALSRQTYATAARSAIDSLPAEYRAVLKDDRRMAEVVEEMQVQREALSRRGKQLSDPELMRRAARTLYGDHIAKAMRQGTVDKIEKRRGMMLSRPNGLVGNNGRSGQKRRGVAGMMRDLGLL